MKDFLPPTPVTLIKDVLQAIIAKDLHSWMMESYVFLFRCSQSITNSAHRNARVHHAHVACRASNVPVLCTGNGHGLFARAENGYALRYSILKLKDIRTNWIHHLMEKTAEILEERVMQHKYNQHIWGFAICLRSTPIREGTSDCRIHRNNNSTPSLCLARTQQCGS